MPEPLIFKAEMDFCESYKEIGGDFCAVFHAGLRCNRLHFGFGNTHSKSVNKYTSKGPSESCPDDVYLFTLYYKVTPIYLTSA